MPCRCSQFDLETLGVGGVTDPRAGEYVHQVDIEVETLDSDVQAQLHGLSPAFSFGEWNAFVNNPASPEQADGWRDFRNQLTHFQEVFDESAVMRDIAGYQSRQIGFYDAFKLAGGKPTRPQPIPGFDPAAAHEAESQQPMPLAEKAIWTVGIIGGLFAVGYVLRGVGSVK